LATARKPLPRTHGRPRARRPVPVGPGGAQLRGAGRSGAGRPRAREPRPRHRVHGRRREGGGPAFGKLLLVHARRLDSLRIFALELLPPGAAPPRGPLLLGLPAGRQLPSVLRRAGHRAGRVRVPATLEVEAAK
jgi:hypothetical protein